VFFFSAHIVQVKYHVVCKQPGREILEGLKQHGQQARQTPASGHQAGNAMRIRINTKPMPLYHMVKHRPSGKSASRSGRRRVRIMMIMKCERPGSGEGENGKQRQKGEK
jgi:hypothetical protein